ASIYNCTNTSFQPLIPPAGNPVRTAFLNTIGVPVPGPCVTETPSADDGRVLAGQSQLMPYTIQNYLNQINNAAPDIHCSAVLGSINAVTPTVLNNASGMARDVYTVVPPAKRGVAPWKSLFVGSPSAVWGNTATIVRNGFGLENPTSKCGDTSIHS